ncbi:MAG: hypothetical protein IB618_03350 [Candidatus Pacearchaeota archaeon]|nr:MAG: hypothetical protein IB618_03350 [Candidatus Pacearchaeota archaeon]
MTWRKYVDKSLKPYIERLILESMNHKESYDTSKDKGKAQMWIALAVLSRQLHDLKLKIDYIERTLQNIGSPKLKQKNAARRKKEEKEVEKFIKELASGKIIKKRTKKISKKVIKKIKKRNRKSISNIKIAKSL